MHEDLVTPEICLALSLSILPSIPKDLARAHRDTHRVFGILGRLARTEGFDITSHLRPFRRSLSPQDLLYAGFHFIEKPGMDKNFGTELLKVLRDQFNGTPEAHTATQRLRTERIGRPSAPWGR
jgi:hypothetical protein